MTDIIVWLNVIIVLVLLGYMVRCDYSISSILVSLVLFMTLHHAYAVIPEFIDRTVANTIHLHTPLLPKLMGGLFLAGISLLLLWRFKSGLPDLFSMLSMRVVAAFMFLFLLSALLVIGFSEHQYLAVSDLLSMSGMLLMSLAVAMLMCHEPWHCGDKLASLYSPVAVVAILVTVIALLEVLLHVAWAVFPLSDGRIVYRAGSTLFNPNMLGLWATVMVLLGTYAWDQSNAARWASGSLIFSGTVCIFFAGSRSSLMLTLAILGLLMVLQLKAGERVISSMKPALAFSALFLLIIVSASLLASGLSGGFAAQSIGLLADRFISLPETILHLLSRQAELVDMIALNGRLEGELVDNGYLAIRNDFGYLALLIWASALGYLLLLGLKRFYQAPDRIGAFVICMLSLVIMSGFVMRSFQVFPAWGGTALALGGYLFWLNGERQCFVSEDSRES